jgi:chromosome partitioning protein
VKIWTVANQKGGVGKTTTTVTLAGLLAARGHRTLMVDTDPHGSLTAYFGLDPDNIEPSLYSLFRAPAPDPTSLVHDTKVERLSLLPASTALATLDRQLGAAPGMGLVMARALARLSSKFDFALIDCSPQLGVLLVNALAACEHLVIPVQTEFLSLKGLERMQRTLAMVQRTRPKPLPCTIVPTLFDRRTRASVECLSRLRESYADGLWDAFIPVDTQFRDASKSGVPLSVLAPGARGVQAYDALLNTLLGTKPDRPPDATLLTTERNVET